MLCIHSRVRILRRECTGVEFIARVRLFVGFVSLAILRFRVGDEGDAQDLAVDLQRHHGLARLQRDGELLDADVPGFQESFEA